MATELSRPARLELLRKRLEEKGLLSEGEGHLLMQMHQMATRIEAAGGEFHVANIINAQGVGLVDATWGDVIFQVAPVKAREIAWMLLEVAAVAEAEGMLWRFLAQEIRLEPHAATSMLMQFRSYRGRDKSSLLVEDADKH